MAFDSSRAAAVAREYDALQGLTCVIMGVGCLGAAFLDQPAVWIALGGGLGSSANAWYVRRFGTVRPAPGRTAWSVLGAVVAVTLVLLGYVLDRLLRGPVLLTLLAVAASLAIGQHLLLRRVGLTLVHRFVHGLVALAALGPLVGLGRGDALLPYVLVVTGAALIVVGAVDHRRLVRAFAPVEVPAEAADRS